jgi:DNA-binding PadR family transcriptional regulator
MMHSFDVEIAAEYGINAAILLQNLDFWIAKNKANKENYIDGRYWTYNSIKAYKELFPYMSERQISKALKKLADEGLIVTGNYNNSAYNHTTWYAITEKGKSILQKCKIEAAKMSNRNSKNVKSIYTDINTDINTNINTDIKGKPARHRYGEYNNVLLSDEEIGKLKAEIPNYQRYIESLSSYMMSTGKTYKSHLATIRNWARKDGVKPSKPETEEERIRREQNEQLLRVMGEI